MSNLNPLTINLHGLNLIEASAGTGKTYTLTTLYLRLLLETGLQPQNILVVTFTEAATQALRHKVRERIAQALYQLEHPQQPNQDQQLNTLFKRVPTTTVATTILHQALDHLDEAAIYTIHSFCQHMLQDYALETGLAFTTELVTDETQLRRAAAADVWRQRLAVANLEETLWIQNHWRNPWQLLTEINSTLAQDELQLLPQLETADSIALQQKLNQLDALLQRIRTAWPQMRDACWNLLADNPALHQTYYRKTRLDQIVTDMDAFAQEINTPTLLPNCLEMLRLETLTQRTLKSKRTPAHPFFDLCNQLDAASLEHMQRLRRALWLQQARTQIQAILDRNKTEQELLSFDDLLKKLDLALAEADTLNHATETLAATIRTRFPVALIDEFQDTDPKQYRIFQKLYLNHPQTGLFLIGDPKQAIYAFRGADVFTYMQARTYAVQRQVEHTLGINWRSNSRLVAALNCIFSNVAVPFLYTNIPFRAVEPKPNADVAMLNFNGNMPTPLQFWVLSPTAATATKTAKQILKVESANLIAARACAEYIATLLQAATAGTAKLGNNPVQSKDIAILVRTHNEGAIIQQALNARNIGCVTLGQDSIFDSEQAQELEIVLQVLAKPNDEGWLRAALVTRLLGWNAAELESLSHNETAWEALLTRFQNYHQLWLERNFILAFQKLLLGENIAQRLLRLPNGERWLTNLLHLAELLQTASMQCAGPEALLHWLRTQRNLQQRTDESNQIRLESDASLVQVVTIHKSKGLEYPIVFIPFPWSLKPHKNSQVLFHDPHNFKPCWDLGTQHQESNKMLQQREELAEQMRLLYVALTRAAQLCVLCWGPVNQAENSALALLLHPDNTQKMPTSRLKILDAAKIKAELEKLAATVPGCVEVRDLPTPTNIQFTGSPIDLTQLQAATFHGKINVEWSVASYSMLTRGDESQQPDHDTTLKSEVPSPATLLNPEPVDLLFNFPAGAESGLFLHAILEHLDFPSANVATVNAAIHNLLPSYASLRTKPPEGATDWSAVAAELITNCLDTPLCCVEPSGEMLRLRDISWYNRLSELEFYYPLSKLTPQRLHSTLKQFPEYCNTAAGLSFTTCQGLMHGFVDLIFRHHDRYYLADYKSNRLGFNIKDYNRDGMNQAMRSHRYDLQYLVYTVALHRFLGQRLPNYSYAQHYGGAFYLFLRGMRPACGTEYGVYFDRPDFQVIQALEGLL